MRKFGFMTGLPRSGSTVLCTMLSQSEHIQTTSTSCTLSLMQTPLNFTLGESRYYDIRDPKSPAWAVSRGILQGAYTHVDKKLLVLEKDRGWGSFARKLQLILGEKPRMLLTARPVTEIIASFLLLSRKTARSRIDENVAELGLPVNDRTRCQLIWERYIYRDWYIAKALWENKPCPVLLLEYKTITTEPQTCVNSISDFFELPHFKVSTTEMKNPTPENDAIYGIPGLHDVRSDLKRISPPAEEILGSELYERWFNKKLDFWAN